MTPLEKYRSLLAEYHKLPLDGAEREEDKLLDELTSIWYALTEAERNLLDSEEPLRYR